MWQRLSALRRPGTTAQGWDHTANKFQTPLRGANEPIGDQERGDVDGRCSVRPTKPCLMQSPALPQLILDEVGLDPIALLQAESE
jgi:hypothetical protein